VRIAILGVGRIGSHCARRFIASGKHEVRLAYLHDRERLDALAQSLGPQASVVPPAEAVHGSELVVLSVPWDGIGDWLSQAGSLAGKIVIDTCNQFGTISLPQAGETAAAHNAARMPGARYTKSFNTLTAQFQADAAARPKDQRIVQWVCGDDAEAKRVVAGLLEDCGYVPVDLGGTAAAAVMESPRRAGAVYGEEYRAGDVPAVLAALRAGRPIPPPPGYG